MFQLYYDTRADALAETLARLLVETGGADPLQPRTVLVPQLGLENWLTRILAERHGIAANIDFMAPAQFARGLLRAWQPDLAPRSPFDRELLQWRLYQVLPRVAADDGHLHDLLHGRQPELRRLQLAVRLAHLFERYQAYRPDVLEDWAGGNSANDSQARLWRAVLATAGEPPRSRLMRDFVRSFGAEGARRPPSLPEHVFAWGCINISPMVLDMLRVASRHAELHFLMPTPCREYWGDLPHRHELASYLEAFADGFMDSRRPIGCWCRWAGSGASSWRGCLPTIACRCRVPMARRANRCATVCCTACRPTSSPWHSQVNDRRKAQADCEDCSIRVQVCHSPLREVQVLHDHLLDMLGRRPESGAARHRGDDAEGGPLRGGGGSGVRRDRRARPAPCALDGGRPRAKDAHPVTSLTMRLLGLPPQRLGLDLLLDVLEVPAVQRALQVEGERLEELRAMAFEAGIRWGEDGADRVAEGLPEFDDFSFAFGRRRLLLGYLLGDDDEEALVEGIAPLSDIESDRAHAFGALLRLERQLHELKRDMRVPRTPRQWQDLFNEHLALLLDLGDDDRDAARALADVRRALAGMVEDTDAAGFDQPLDWSVCANWSPMHSRPAAPASAFSMAASVCARWCRCARCLSGWCACWAWTPMRFRAGTRTMH